MTRFPARLGNNTLSSTTTPQGSAKTGHFSGKRKQNAKTYPERDGTVVFTDAIWPLSGV